MTSGRKRLGLGAAGSLVIAGVVGITSLTASGQDTATGGATVPYGTITIELVERAGTVSFEPSGGGAAFTQALSVATPCSTLVAGPIHQGDDAFAGTLLAFSATGGTNPNVQLPGTAIGVTDGANCGDPAGLIGPGETLTITLGDHFPDDVLVGDGSLNIGKSRPPDGSLQLAHDGGDFGSEISIATGGQVVPAGANFTSVSLRSTATQNSRGLSLMGGTVLNLVVPSGFDEAVDCGESVLVEGAMGSAAKTAEFARLDNVEKPDHTPPPCEDVGVTVTINEHSVFWDNGTIGLVNGTTQNVSALVTIEWSGIDPSEPELLQTFINYQGLEDGPRFPVQWCVSFDAATNTGELPHGPIDEIDGTEINGQVPWCLVSNDEVLEGSTISQTQVLFGAGDPITFK